MVVSHIARDSAAYNNPNHHYLSKPNQCAVYIRCNSTAANNNSTAANSANICKTAPCGS